MVTCTCCDVGQDIPDTLYVRCFNLLDAAGDAADCSDECDAINDQCFELTRQGQCAWAAVLPQNATCYPFSILVVELNCNGSEVWFSARWLQTTSNVAFFETSPRIMAPTIDCTSCPSVPYKIHPSGSFPTAGCNHHFGYLDVAFQPSLGGCCQYCPDQYQVTLAGFSDPDPEQDCERASCEELNATYLVDFVASDVTVPQSSVGDLTGFCLYRKTIEIDCDTFPETGFCTLDVYIKTFDDCTTHVTVILTFDQSGFFCTNEANYEVQGWEDTVDQHCREVNAVIANVLLDTDALCRFEGTTATIVAVP